jgi:hypothetical protein
MTYSAGECLAVPLSLLQPFSDLIVHMDAFTRAQYEWGDVRS